MPTIAHRSRVILLAVALAVGGVAVPLSALVFYSDARAGREEQERLDGIASRMAGRAHHVIKESVSLLHTLDALDLVPCSPRHIGHLRTLTLHARAVGEIGHFANGLLACTSWGVTETLILQRPPDFYMNGDIAVTVNMMPQVSNSRPVIALQYRGNNVLINPVQLVDVLGEPNVQIVLATAQGQVLSQLNNPDPVLVAHLLRQTIAGASMISDDNNILGVAHGNDLVGIAIEPNHVLAARLAQERQGLLPVGAVIAVITIIIVVWLLRRRASPVGELAIAVRKREFEVHYQPIIALQNGHCVGAEALVRWRRPDGSLVRPDLFIPLAEETGLITPITEQVLDNIMNDLQALLIKHPALHVAINVAAADITSGRILDMVKQSVTASGIRPDQIWLEATERGLLEASAQQTITQARQAGYRVAIDDFGTGYAGLSYLQAFKFDALKIDKCFIDSIGTDSATSSVTPHIISMAQALQLRLVAEGVETQTQADYLTQSGVDCAQGWLYSRPLTAAAFIDYCRTNLAPSADPPTDPEGDGQAAPDTGKAHQPAPSAVALGLEGLALMPAGA